MLVFGAQKYATESNLTSHGLHTTATVSLANSVWMGQGDASTNHQDKYSYSLDVQFRTGHGSQSANIGVTSRAFRGHPTGSSVEIVYDPNDPEVAMLSGAGNNSNPSSVMLLMGTVFTLFGVGMAFAIPIYLRQLAQKAAPSLDEALRAAEHATPAPHWIDDPLHEDADRDSRLG